MQKLSKTKYKKEFQFWISRHRISGNSGAILQVKNQLILPHWLWCILQMMANRTFPKSTFPALIC